MIQREEFWEGEVKLLTLQGGGRNSGFEFEFLGFELVVRTFVDELKLSTSNSIFLIYRIACLTAVVSAIILEPVSRSCLYLNTALIMA